jgi:hypothetical protein
MNLFLLFLWRSLWRQKVIFFERYLSACCRELKNKFIYLIISLCLEKLKICHRTFLTYRACMLIKNIFINNIIIYSIQSVPKPTFQQRKSHNYMRSHHHYHQNQEIVSPQHEELARYMNDCKIFFLSIFLSIVTRWNLLYSFIS